MLTNYNQGLEEEGPPEERAIELDVGKVRREVKGRGNSTNQDLDMPKQALIKE